MKISPKCQTWVNGNDFHIGVGSDVVLALYQRCTLKDYISYLLPT